MALLCMCMCECTMCERAVEIAIIELISQTVKQLVSIFCACIFPQRSKRDFSNFDSDFISENPTLTPIDGDTVRSLNQTEFDGFTFTNSEFKD